MSRARARFQKPIKIVASPKFTFTWGAAGQPTKRARARCHRWLLLIVSGVESARAVAVISPLKILVGKRAARARSHFRTSCPSRCLVDIEYTSERALINSSQQQRGATAIINASLNGSIQSAKIHKRGSARARDDRVFRSGDGQKQNSCTMSRFQNQRYKRWSRSLRARRRLKINSGRRKDELPPRKAAIKGSKSNFK